MGDEHDGYPFHIHVAGIMYERVNVYLWSGQCVVLFYNLIIALVFIYHSKRQPRIINSVQAHNKMKRRFGCIWCPTFVFMSIVVMILSYMAFYIRMFSDLWIEKLMEHEQFYACSDPSLWLDLD